MTGPETPTVGTGGPASAPRGRGTALLAAGAGALLLAAGGLLAAGVLGPGAGTEEPACCVETESGAGGPLVPPGTGPLPVLGEVPGFSFTERSGRTVTRGDLVGRIWVADFIFTSCAGTCPVMSLRMADVHGALRTVPGALCVSFSVDPERDTPEALRAYADRFAATADGWWFLRGDQGDVVRLQHEGFRMGSAEDPFLHSERFVLVDRRGRIRGWYHGTDEEAVEGLIRDVARLEEERP